MCLKSWNAVMIAVVTILLVVSTGHAENPCACPCQSTGPRCIKDCAGMPDGDYQSCTCCHGQYAFISCVAGLTYHRPCPADLVWADEIKRCNWTSRTCRECVKTNKLEFTAATDPTTPCDCPCRKTGRTCITSCAGRPDGDYQSCGCCHGSSAFITCSNGNLYYRPCPANLVWADDAKICNYTSKTCHECDYSIQTELTEPTSVVESELEQQKSPDGVCPCKSTGRSCITSCQGLPDGDYQSCQCCHGYVSCTGGHMSPYRRCPANLVWADNTKKCNYSSRTCTECVRQLDVAQDDETDGKQLDVQIQDGGQQKAPEAPPCDCMSCPCRSTGSTCISSCADKPDGDYQSCHCCHAFVTCIGGLLIGNRACPATTVWADDIKRCNFTSNTCRECVSSKQDNGLSALVAVDPDTDTAAASSQSSSSSCPCKSTGTKCVASCQGKLDGDYQSCRCCHGDEAYVTCVGGRLFYRTCPFSLVWDDELKVCNHQSKTCTECDKKVLSKANSNSYREYREYKEYKEWSRL
jgi:hypothetical protein